MKIIFLSFSKKIQIRPPSKLITLPQRSFAFIAYWIDANDLRDEENAITILLNKCTDSLLSINISPIHKNKVYCVICHDLKHSSVIIFTLVIL